MQEHANIKQDIIPANWISGTPLVVKYVDDILGCERIYAPAGKKHISTSKETCSVHACKLEEMIDSIKSG